MLRAAEVLVKREVRTWWSPRLGREMGVAAYGHYGKPLILFPTGGGDFLDVERFHLVGALGPLVDAGRLKVYAIDSVCKQSWTNPEVPPAQKAHVQARYDAWLTEELLPFVRWHSGGTDQRFAAAGASIGGYHALNVVCKHPDVFDTMVGLSGTYSMDRRMQGACPDDYYYNAPHRFVPNLPEGPDLHALREARFVFGLGRRHENPAYSWQMADVLGRRGVWNRVEVWGDDHGHDWPTWRAMLPMFLDRLVG